ncbi:MAG: hypothetical protein QNJ72_19160 [Pleurocapsa sp. MO_226.B13]|nr:hypothetical protein [Pleurocapsa sp. MO_226.B13]
MSTKRVPIDKKRNNEGRSKLKIEPVGTDALFESKVVRQEETNRSDETNDDSSKDETKNSSSNKPDSKVPEEKNKAEEKENLIKTTVYIEEDNFLGLEDIQLKLKRSERRRVTKNELFNKALKLLIDHYS